ncbi:MAG TPA: DUF5989 family protein [Thermoguttaceae bacterium]
MINEPSKLDQQRATKFEHQASQPQTGVFGEMLHFLAQNKKWWLVPVILVLLLVGIMVMLGGTGAAPFIYTLF